MKHVVRILLAVWLAVGVTASPATAGRPVDCHDEYAPPGSVGRGDGRKTEPEFSLVSTATEAADPTVSGSWTAPFDLGLSAIHTTLLHTGKVLIFSYPDEETGHDGGSEAILWDPVTEAITNVNLPVERDLFCAAHSFLPDGRVFTTGGHVKHTPNAEERGIKETFFFNPDTAEWTAGPLMSYARWYPSNVQLADGKTLIFGGNENEKTPVLHVESYDPVTNALTVLPNTANKDLPLYPRMHLTRKGMAFVCGPYKGTQYFNPTTNSWTWVGNMVGGGARNNGNAVVLPGLNQILAFGGKNANGVMASAEIIDFSVPKPAWRATGSMATARHHANAVLLPDGTVLAVGGGQGGSYEAALAVRTPELFDPATGKWTSLAPQTAPRIYHSTAVLLPDGRVLSAGMDNGAYEYTGEVYSPPYLFRGPRPTITFAPGALRYGDAFTIETPDAAAIQRVALVKPGSVTHSTDFSQRYVDLPFTAGDGTLSTGVPTNPNDAPAGWYMLFVTSSSGVPSVASWVHIS